MKIANLKYGLIALAGLGITANANAELTCDDIVFSPEAFAAYELIDQACLEMVTRDDGNTYAKLTARVVAQTASGTHLRYRLANGELAPSHLSTAPEDFQAMISGKPVEMKNLDVRQTINIYVSDKYWVDAAAIVEEEMTEEAVEEAVVEVMVEEAIVEEVMEEEMAEELPTTAGPLPWLALFGSLFLILGGALRFSRKQ
jgi:hypothetical protein